MCDARPHVVQAERRRAGCAHARADGEGQRASTAARARAASCCARRAPRRRQIVGVASPFASNEDLEAFRRLPGGSSAPGTARFAVPRGESDEILIEAEKAPNAAGCRGARHGRRVERLSWRSARARDRARSHDCTPRRSRDVRRVVLIDSHESALLGARATWCCPRAPSSRSAARFTNADGLVQRFEPGRSEPAFEALAEREALGRDRRGAHGAAPAPRARAEWRRPSDLRLALHLRS